ncbi:MAG: FecR domain-containing protein, partial [Hyphomonas sp.]|nr:FecR domain-containing protein [Hyphomonas sp.]
TLAVLDRSKFAAPGARMRRPGTFVWTGAVAAAAALGVGLFLFTRPGPAMLVEPVPSPEAFATIIGEQREVMLADGSSVTLNTGTRLEVVLTAEERFVRLEEGQALFEVASAEAPFVVEAGGRRTTALGTRFDVYLMPDGIAVTLVEGSVRVDGAGGRVLEPGQQLRVSGAEVSVLDVDTDAVTGWQAGMVQFRDVPLAEAIAELNRYSNVKLRVEDPQLAAERLSGVFTAGDQELFLESLALYLPVETVRSGDEILIRRRPG